MISSLIREVKGQFRGDSAPASDISIAPDSPPSPSSICSSPSPSSHNCSG